ncbi:MAG: hypothetical protein WC406_08775 [Methanoregula sp.]
MTDATDGDWRRRTLIDGDENPSPLKGKKVFMTGLPQEPME